MASIYKRSRDKKRKNAPYWIEYRDHDGARRVAKGFTDKGLTEQLAAKLENEAMLRRSGLIDPEQERRQASRQSPIEGHLAAFERSLENNTPKYRKLAMTRIRRLVDGCGFKTLGDLSGERVEEFLRELRRDEDLGARTYNHYLQAIDAFAKWLVATKRLPSSPLSRMERLNAETDVRHRRRALTPEEVARLLASARGSGEEIQGYTGEERARIYLFSYLTGLRRQEMGSLTPSSFTLDGPRPTVTVEAACSKHRRKDVLPLHPELLVQLRSWMQHLGQDEPLFPKIARRKTWLMVKKDLERVGIPYETAEGVADFHAAGRHSYVTGLLRHGATLPEAKELARHADVRMTMRYTHIGLDDQAEALAALPAPDASAGAWLGIGWDPGGAAGRDDAPDDTDPGPDGIPVNEQSPAGAGLASSSDVTCHQKAGYSEVEAAGIAPASRDPSVPASTCVADRLIVGRGAPVGRVPFGLSHHEFNLSRNGRLDSGDPALTSSGGASGRRPAAKPLGLLVRQPYGERESSRHLSFGRLLTRPADQPRHATWHFSNPVDPGSPPIVKDHHLDGRTFQATLDYSLYDASVKGVHRLA